MTGELGAVAVRSSRAQPTGVGLAKHASAPVTLAPGIRVHKT